MTAMPESYISWIHLIVSAMMKTEGFDLAVQPRYRRRG
jgi:hypothetical protein